MVKKEDIKSLACKALEYDEFLVDCKISKSNEITVYVDGFQKFSIDDCRRISKAIEAGLDRKKEDFELTVSTPGLDKPFKVREQYNKYLGKKVELILKNSKKLIADLQRVDDDGIQIAYRKNKKQVQEHMIYDEISKTKPCINF
ncbi:MAG: ribosome assembly cofactor RimP [Bacteroidota bacterium]|nr:ribosome assembly cofactor RimP [Bacteroidota bacterium]